MWFFALIVVVLIGAVAVVASGRWGAMSTAYDDRPDMSVPARQALTSDDIETVRFGVGLRGYRMDEVDTLIERIAREVAERDRRIADLERAVTPIMHGPEGAGFASRHTYNPDDFDDTGYQLPIMVGGDFPPEATAPPVAAEPQPAEQPQPEAPQQTEAQAPQQVEAQPPEPTEGQAPQQVEAQAPQQPEAQAPQRTEAQPPRQTGAQLQQQTEAQSLRQPEAQSPQSNEADRQQSPEDELQQSSQARASQPTQADLLEPAESQTLSQSSSPQDALSSESAAQQANTAPAQPFGGQDALSSEGAARQATSPDPLSATQAVPQTPVQQGGIESSPAAHPGTYSTPSGEWDRSSEGAAQATPSGGHDPLSHSYSEGAAQDGARRGSGIGGASALEAPLPPVPPATVLDAPEGAEPEPWFRDDLRISSAAREAEQPAAGQQSEATVGVEQYGAGQQSEATVGVEQHVGPEIGEQRVVLGGADQHVVPETGERDVVPDAGGQAAVREAGEQGVVPGEERQAVPGGQPVQGQLWADPGAAQAANGQQESGENGQAGDQAPRGRHSAAPDTGAFQRPN
jgi:DivIVA domain-containing protein